MKNLISMRDFVLNIYKTKSPESGFYPIIRYAEFLSLKLEIWMFVPCKLVDGVWVVLKKTIIEKYQFGENEIGSYEIPSLEYEQAKERCLFEGFEFVKELKNEINSDIKYYRFLWNGNYFNLTFGKIIEDLVKYNLQLTQTALKQID